MEAGVDQEHRPFRHCRMGLSLHLIPHPPQFERSELVSTSQPFAGLWSQSLRHGGHTHAYLSQTKPVAQGAPHAEQCCVDEARFASQPLATLPSQSANPDSHTSPQRPEELHVAAEACAPVVQEIPQQFAIVNDEHWASAEASGGGGRTQPPRMHTSPIRHDEPQPPQWMRLFCVSASQPLAGLRSQSLNVVSQTTASSSASAVSSLAASGAVSEIDRSSVLASGAVSVEESASTKHRPAMHDWPTPHEGLQGAGGIADGAPQPHAAIAANSKAPMIFIRRGYGAWPPDVTDHGEAWNAQ